MISLRLIQTMCAKKPRMKANKSGVNLKIKRFIVPGRAASMRVGRFAIVRMLLYVMMFFT